MPTTVAPSYSVTVAPGSAVPLNVGVVTFVIESDDDEPLSLAAASAGADGASGGTVSIRTSTDSVSLSWSTVSRAEKSTVWMPSPETVTAAVAAGTVVGGPESTA